MDTLKKTAKIAGFGYLVIFVSGIFANFVVLEGLMIKGDATATAEAIVNNSGLFRAGIVSFVVMVIFDIVLTWALYGLLKPVNRDLALLSAWFRLINCAIFGVALFNLVNVQQVLSGVGYLSVFDAGHLHAQAYLYLDAFNNTWLVGLIFFGIHLLFLGYLIIRSEYLPKVIGALLLFAGAGYLVDSTAHFVLSNYADYEALFAMIVILPGVVGELSLTIWLLVKGVKKQADQNPVLASLATGH